MQNLNAKISPLAFDFQSGDQPDNHGVRRSFSSTKEGLRQRYLKQFMSPDGASASKANTKKAKPSTTEQLFTEIKDLLADF